MKYFAIFSLVLFFSTAAAASVFLNDVPEGHWAGSAVSELIKMGVTSGFPDGTFRGARNINRYEMASFLAKFAESFSLSRGKNEKLLEELKTELSLIKFGKTKDAFETQWEGAIESHYKIAEASLRGGQGDYRFKLSLFKKFDPNSNFKVRLDTMDAGFNAASARSITTNLIDIESSFKLGALDYKVNLGPGVMVHTDSEGYLPSENYTVYIRPKSAINISGNSGNLSYSAAYVTRQVAASGKVGVHELTGKIGYDFGKLALCLQPRYICKIDGPRDILAEMGIDFKPDQRWETDLLASVGSFSEGQKGLYLKLTQKIKDLWGIGNAVVLRFDRVGSKYGLQDWDVYAFSPVNNFERLILGGTMDFGVEIKQKIWGQCSLEYKSDYVLDENGQYGASYPGTYFLWQLNLSHEFSPAVSASAFYQSYHVPSGVAQFSDSAPLVSHIFGIGFKHAF